MPVTSHERRRVAAIGIARANPACGYLAPGFLFGSSAHILYASHTQANQTAERPARARPCLYNKSESCLTYLVPNLVDVIFCPLNSPIYSTHSPTYTPLSLSLYILISSRTDAPEIEVEHPFVHTGIGHETQLICIVHAEPSPQVIWYKDTTQLGVTEQHSQQVLEENRGAGEGPTCHVVVMGKPPAANMSAGTQCDGAPSFGCGVWGWKTQ